MMRIAIAFLHVCGALRSQCRGQEQSQAATNASASAGMKAPLVIPQPKSLRLGWGEFRVPPGAKWVLRAAARDERLWRAAEVGLRRQVRCVREDGSAVDNLGLRCPAAGRIFPSGNPSLAGPRTPKATGCAVETNGLVILAATAQGAFYGLQTLAQLWQESPSGRSCPALEIEDWPAMRFRGVHWFPSASGRADASEAHHQCVRRVQVQSQRDPVRGRSLGQASGDHGAQRHLQG